MGSLHNQTLLLVEPTSPSSLLQVQTVLLLRWHLYPRLNGPAGESVKLVRHQLATGRRKFPADMVEAAAALRDGPGVAGEPAVLGGGGAVEPQVLGPVHGERLVDMAAGIDKGALRPLPGQGEYLGLVTELDVATAAEEDAALVQEAQLGAQTLDGAVDTEQQSGASVLRIRGIFVRIRIRFILARIRILGSGYFLD